MRGEQLCQPWNSAKAHFHIAFQKILPENLQIQLQIRGWSRGTYEMQGTTFSPEENEFLHEKGFVKIKPVQWFKQTPGKTKAVGINGSTDIAKSRILQERGKTIQARYWPIL